MKTMKIGWLFPDTLYLHGERGNILALERFARKAGFAPEIEKIGLETENFEPMAYDVLFCAPGEITSFPVVIAWLTPYIEKLNDYIEAGKPLLVTGTSVAIWCKEIQRADGSCFSGLGLLSATAKEKDAVYGDDNDFTCDYGGETMEIIGNQIQMADFFDEEEAPFGKLIYGYGNTGKDRREGFVKKNAIFTNTLGPMLVTNPWLTVKLIEAAARAKGEAAEWSDCDFELEQKSFATKKEFILGKETKLTNCKG